MSESSPPGNRRFWTYWSAYSTSTFGTAITAVALPLTAVQVLHANAFETGLLAAAAYIAWLVIGLPAGAIVQRLPLRGAQVWMDIIRFLALISVPVLWWMGKLSIVQLIVVAVVISFADVIFFVASATFIPSIVPKEELQAKNSLMSGTHAVSQLGGPSIGGLLVQILGPVITVAIDALSYAASAILLRTLPSSKSEAKASNSSIRKEVAEGLRFTISDSVMRATLWNATIINFIGGIQLALFAIYLVRELNAPALLIGLLLAAEGLGSLLGASIVAPLTKRIGSAQACLYASVVLSVGAFLIPAGSGVYAYVFFAVGCILFAIGTVVTSTTTRTYRQLATPTQLLSRVMASVRFISWGAVPVGSLLAGILGSSIGLRETLIVSAFISLASVVVLFASPVRKLRDFPEEPQQEKSAGFVS